MVDDLLSREVDGVPLGLCLDVLRGTTPPLKPAEKKLLDEIRNGIGGDAGIVAAAELECVLRKGFRDFQLTPSDQVALINTWALDLGIEILS